MKNFQHKKGYGPLLRSKPALIVFGLVILLFAWNITGFIGKAQDTAKNKRIAQDKITQLTKEKEKLTTEIANLHTDKGKEESIREKFGYAKEGEGLIVVVDETSSTSNPPETSSGISGFFKNLFR